MRHFRRYAAATVAAAVMTLTATAPANAIVDQNGRVVGIIITEDGQTYY